MICGICNQQESKYKCPKCSIVYCSISCYKSPIHSHENIPIESPASKTKTKTLESKISIPESNDNDKDDKYFKLLKDEKIQYLLNQSSLQIHLLTIIKILNDSSFTLKNLTIEQKLDIANLKLNDLRNGGIEENELIEEFIQRVLLLLNE